MTNLWVLTTLVGLSGFAYLVRLAFRELDKIFGACSPPESSHLGRVERSDRPDLALNLGSGRTPHHDESFAAFHRRLRRQQLLDDLSLTRRRLP